MTIDREKFLHQTESFPHSPGVYIMRDRTNTPIYVGKAIDLHSRVRSYFLDPHADRPHIPFMLQRLESIEWIATSNETEALILEANLIRSNKPRFNVELKDDKHFPYIKVTVNEPFPRLLIVRRVERDGAVYLGPYTDVRAMRKMVVFARRIFRIRDCKKKLPLKRPVRPCINYSMGRCSGACAGKISQEKYRQQVVMLIKFLSGHRKDLLQTMETDMNNASEQLKFEEAALIRDQIQLIRDASRMQRVDLRLPDTDSDVFGMHEDRGRICLAVLRFREGLLMSARHFIIKRETWDYSEENHDYIVLQFYLSSGKQLPSELIVPENAGFNPSTLQEWFETELQARVTVTMPQRGMKTQLVAMARKNAMLYLSQNAPADPLEDVEALQKALSLPRLPEVIEAFDISNLGQTYSVAGMVQFKGGRPNKSHYRKYKIKSVEGQNDFAAMNEVVGRRLRRLASEGKPLPDLLLIDGGKGQLSAAMEPLQGIPNAPMIASLAKKEELLFSPFAQGPVALPPTHPGRKLAQRIRDEVHRFTITYHRTIRGKVMRRSLLEGIPGIGKERAARLLKHFGSVQRLRAATPGEIAGVPGFSEKQGQRILEELSRNG